MILYSIGKIVNTHGIKGEVKIKKDTDFDRFKKGSTVYIDGKLLKIRSVRIQGELYLVAFENLLSLTDVEHLKHQEVFTSDEPTDLKENEYHLPKLIGLSVLTQNNYLVGHVDSLIEVPQGHLLKVIKSDGKYVLIPFVSEFIKSVTDEEIMIDTIEGLI